MDQSNITDVLLIKYLGGEVTSDERTQVQQWLKASADNKKHFYSLKLLWEQSRHTLVKSTINAEDALARFKQKLSDKQHKPKLVWFNYNWLKVAAILLLMAGSGLVIWNMNAVKEKNQVNINQTVISSTESKKSEQSTAILEETIAKTEPLIPSSVKPIVKISKPVASEKETIKANIAANTIHNYNNKKYICNGTPCPLEICITQSVKCQNNKTAAYSTCSTLEPDESGQLSLKMNDKLAQNCSLTIQEIRITRLTTGESIVLNANSSPATAQDLYNYITGQKKGDILAGVFHTDCDNEESEHILTFDNNNYGHLILQ